MKERNIMEVPLEELTDEEFKKLIPEALINSNEKLILIENSELLESCKQWYESKGRKQLLEELKKYIKKLSQDKRR